MGMELWCSETSGKLHMWNTVVDSFERRNVTPTQVANHMHKRVMEDLPRLRENRRIDRQNPLGYFFDNMTPVVTDNDLRRYATKIKKIWLRAAKEKVDECKAVRSHIKPLRIQQTSKHMFEVIK